LPQPLWKLNLRPASYNGVLFYVEVQARQGGFRLVPHEFPKKNIPWSENMGRRVRHWAITGYLVYSPALMPDVFAQRDALIAALDTPGPGLLVLPTGLHIMDDEPPGLVMVDAWTIVERQEAGGWCSAEMMFLEAGQAPSSLSGGDTQSVSTAAAQNAITASKNSGDLYVNPPGGPGTAR